MCGIAGFTLQGPEARGVLGAVNRALTHRGPDASGILSMRASRSATHGWRSSILRAAPNRASTM
jgi:asparagine synthetase B (glutamine-hydrolysing)